MLRKYLNRRLARIAYVDTVWSCSYDAIASATAELAGIRPGRVRCEHVNWAYPMFDIVEASWDERGWSGDSAEDDAFTVAGGRANVIGIEVGRHAALTANTLDGMDYWWFDGGEYGYVEPSDLASRIGVLDRFVFEVCEGGHVELDFRGVPTDHARGLKAWSRKIEARQERYFAELSDDPR